MTKELIFLIIGTLIVATIIVYAKGSPYIPKNAFAVKPFDIKKYMGNWYEIARFDFRFERNLNNTTAKYTLNENGTVKVVNRGYDYVKKKWKESVGKARFRSATDEAKLKVSFFGPFYSGYNVIAIDPDYQYALIAGESLKYLWILSRQKTIPEDVKQRYIQLAQSIGYDTSKFVWVQHS